MSVQTINESVNEPKEESGVSSPSDSGFENDLIGQNDQTFVKGKLTLLHILFGNYAYSRVHII